MTADQVPGMAEAVEQRRLERNLTINEFAARSKLTRQGLDDVRQGRRKQYQERTIMGVARALQWERDWYQRLLAGQRPKPAPEPDANDRLSQVEERLDRVERMFQEIRDGLAGG